VSAAELQAYAHPIEAVRQPVNDLLEGADPILDADHAESISPAVASPRMSALAPRFAGHRLTVNALAIEEVNRSNAGVRATRQGGSSRYLRGWRPSTLPRNGG